MTRIDEVASTQFVHDQLVSVCNEEKIYDWLFRKLFDGKSYREDNAIDFFRRGVEGWKSNKTFVFLLVTGLGEVVAAIDIKAPDLVSSEIGYWASERHRGCMTNTVVALLSIAKDAGYRSLFARVRKENQNSAGVLTRSGFKPSSTNEDETYDFYQIDLNKDNENQSVDTTAVSAPR